MTEIEEQLNGLMAATFHQGVVSAQLEAAREELQHHEREMQSANQHVGVHYFKIREILNIPDEGEEKQKEN